MPFIDQEDQTQTRIVPTTADNNRELTALDPSFGEAFNAAFENENSIGSLFFRETKPFTDDEEFKIKQSTWTPPTNIDSMPEDVQKVLRTSRTQDEYEFMLKSYYEGEENKRILDASGMTGIATQAMVGLIEPSMLIPYFGEIKALSTAGRVLEGAARIGSAAAIGTAIDEIGLHQTQPFRTVEESLYTIGGAALLGTLGGGLYGKLSKAQVNDLVETVSKISDDLPENKRIFDEVYAPKDEPKATSKVGDEVTPSKVKENIEPIKVKDDLSNVVDFVSDTKLKSLEKLRIKHTKAVNKATDNLLVAKKNLAESEKIIASVDSPDPGLIKRHEQLVTIVKNAEAKVTRTQKQLDSVQADETAFQQTMKETMEFRSQLESVEQIINPSPVDNYVYPKTVDGEDIEWDWLDEFDYSNQTIGGVGAEGLNTTLDDLSLVGGKTVENLAKAIPLKSLQSAAVRGATSPFKAIRQITQELVPDAMLRRGYKAGLVAKQSVHTIIDRLTINRRVAVRNIQKDTYSQYISRTKHDAQPVLSMDEFSDEVGKALRRNDTHTIPEVQEAARRLRNQIYRPMMERLLTSGVYDKETMVQFAESYFTRTYDIDKIVSRTKEFKTFLGEQFKLKNPTMDQYDIEVSVNKVYDQLVNHDQGVVLKIESPRGAPDFTKGRALDIDDTVLEPWLVSNAFESADQYVNRATRYTEFIAKFGDVNLTEVLDDLDVEFKMKYDAIPDGAEYVKQKELLEQNYRDDRQMLTLLRDQLLGWNSPTYTPAVRTLKLARQWNVLRSLGGMTISAIPDVARLVGTHGLRNTAKFATYIVKNKGIAAADRKQLQSMAIGFDRILNTRLLKYADLDEMGIFGKSRAEKFTEAATNKFSTLTGMTWWNDTLKSMAGTMSYHRVLDISTQLASGKQISVDDLNFIHHLGLQDGVLADIGQVYLQKGKIDDPFKSLDLDELNIYQADVIRNAIHQSADEIINTVNPGNIPMVFMDKSHGPITQTILQFKSFMFASHQQTFIAGLQGNKRRLFEGAILAAGLGTMVTWLKDKLTGREVPDDPAEWFLEAADRSGWWAMFFEYNNIMDKVTYHNLSVHSLLGATDPRRYQSRGVAGALLGPTADLFDKTVAAANIPLKALNGDDVSAGDIANTRRLIPFQNMHAFSLVMDEIENATNETLDTKNAKEKPGLNFFTGGK